MKIDIQSKSFGANPVLGQISFDVDVGEVVALTGPSGIGKSTLVRILAGLDRHFTGQVDDIGQVGFVFQEPNLLPWRSLVNNITVATGCRADAAQTALEKVELGNRGEAYPDQLSLGQQRRVALARALAVNPQMLILDEAFASLDEATAKRMRTLMQTVLDEYNFKTILVTHNLQEAVELSDRVLVLDGQPAQIVLDHTLPPRHRRDCQDEVALLRRI